MGKSRAEVQRAYRERKKAKEGELYLTKERQRVKKYYVPTNSLPKKNLKERREKIRDCMRQKRMKESNNLLIENNDENNENKAGKSSAYQTRSKPQLKAPLLVKMDFKAKQERNKIQTRKRTSRSLSNANYKLMKLKQEIQDLKRQNWKVKKRLQRKEHKRSHSQQTPENSTSSPMRKANEELRNANLTPRKYQTLQSKLTFHNCLVSEIRQATSNEKKKFAVLKVVTGGGVVRHHKYVRRLSRNIKVNRKQLLKIQSKNQKERLKTRLKAAREELRSQVVAFFERDDNSTILPGKRDEKKVGKEKKQKRILNDYLNNLYQKFRVENIGAKISLSVFTRFRPANFILASFGSRRTCLCQRHQNMALKVKVLKALNVTTTSNPDQLIRQMTDDGIMEKIAQLEDRKVEYLEWKRVEVEEKGRRIKRMNIVKCESSKQEFTTLMQKTLADFRSHVYRVQTQYEEIRNLKENLPKGNVVCQMDFAENYSCIHADEVQSAYFDKASVTLHPVVMYYKADGDTNLHHKSFVFVSDEPGHNSSTVYAFIKELIPLILETAPRTKTVHYITDSPTSQYRNKYIFHLLTLHDKLFDGITATWHYFESGHGKGPCDGVGGTSKRLADMAVRQQKVIIQTPMDFFNWGTSQESSSIKYVFVSKDKCRSAYVEMSEWNAQPVKGTMTLHAVIPLSGSSICIRRTSCFCTDCFSDGAFNPICDGWQTVFLPRSNGNVDTDLQHSTVVQEAQGYTQRFQNDTFVASLYDDTWYICKVLEFDSADGEYLLSFMTKCNIISQTMKWPSRSEELWVNEDKILCPVQAPKPIGISSRMYKITLEDFKRVADLIPE